MARTYITDEIGNLWATHIAPSGWRAWLLWLQLKVRRKQQMSPG